MEEEEEEDTILAKRMKFMTVKYSKLRGTGDEKNPLSPTTNPMLLPENWEQIFSNLTSPTDFLAVITSCQEWNKLLHSKKTQNLLLLVLPILFEYLPLRTILELRLVNSPIFKKIVDSTLLERSTNLDLIFSHDPRWLRCEPKFSLHSQISSLRSLSLIQMHSIPIPFHQRAEALSISQATTNPFLTGNLTIELELGEQVGAKVETLLQTVARLGHKIYSLKLKISMSRSIFSTLCALLSKFPNLKNFQLNSSIPPEQVSSFRVERLPPLPFLESLCLLSFSAKDRAQNIAVIMPFLQKYGRQLKLFSCHGRLTDSKAFGVSNLSIIIPNLSHFKIQPINAATMMKLALVPWKNVTHLRICGYTHSPTQRSCYLVDVIRVVNNFRETLSVLELLVTVSFSGSLVVEKVESGEMKEAPNLKKVTTAVENLSQEWFWKFLEASCGNLEELHFQVFVHDPLLKEDKKEVRRAFGVCRKLKKIVFWFEEKPRIVLRR